MSLPDGFLDELRARLSLAQVAGRKVTWDPKKTNQAKGDFWAPCPFHTEKTASFHVDDKKGFYYCFGCHEKGDAIGFVKATENVGFMEAVEILAREAGLSMPARDPRAQAKMDRNKHLAGITEAAAQFFRLQLRTAAAGFVRDYLDHRGLLGPTQDQFEIGYAPKGRNLLCAHLKSKGFSDADIVETGMAIAPDDGGSPYDRFRNRLMFPIRDLRKRVIAFGGRAMDDNQPAKYINSPETPLFDKGRTLYNHGPAREAAGKTNQLIVAEGYVDVIALSQAGFANAVAPLGTAITQTQLELLWRIHPEPIIALDGDKAGLRAAYRLIDLALPLLSAGKSLRFVLLPEGQDPDDLIKSSGAEAMQDLLDHSEPMVELIWTRETQGGIFDSPERRASLDQKLRDLLRQIPDRTLRRHYGDAIAQRRQALFFGDRGGNSGPGSGRGAQAQSGAPGGYGGEYSGGYRGGGSRHNPVRHETKNSLVARATDPALIREATILTAAILAPDAALANETALERAAIQTESLKKIHLCLLENLGDDLTDDQASVRLRGKMTSSLGFDPIDQLREFGPIAAHPFLGRDLAAATDPDHEMRHSGLARTLTEELVKHAALIGIALETAEAEQDLQGLADERITERLKQVSQARSDALRAEDPTEAKGQKDDEAALRSKLQDFLEHEIWVKKKR